VLAFSPSRLDDDPDPHFLVVALCVCVCVYRYRYRSRSCCVSACVRLCVSIEYCGGGRSRNVHRFLFVQVEHAPVLPHTPVQFWVIQDRQRFFYLGYNTAAAAAASSWPNFYILLLFWVELKLCIPRIVTNALAILQLLIFYFVTKRIVEITHTHTLTNDNSYTYKRNSLCAEAYNYNYSKNNKSSLKRN